MKAKAPDPNDDLRPEYDFDFSHAERGRYYKRLIEEGPATPPTELSEEEGGQEAKFFTALQLFEQGSLSSGRAAQMCGIGKVQFLLRAGRLGVAVVDLDQDEIAQEFD